MRAPLALALLFLATAASAAIVDDLDDVSRWTAAPSDGVSLALVPDHGAMRMDFDFRGHGGWAAARRTANIELPENYRFTFRLRGETPPNTLEIKFIDPSGENVWWLRRLAWEFPHDWTEVVADKRNIEFAWGPSANHVLTRIGAIEVTVTAATGGKGSVWLDRIDFDELPRDASNPVITASSTQEGQTADRAMDGRADTAWRSGAGGAQSLTLDLRTVRQFGGFTIHWAADSFASDYDVSTSVDGIAWTRIRSVRSGNGGHDDLQTPNAAGRYIRLDLQRGAGDYAINEITVEPPSFGDRAITVYQRMAHDSLRGRYPRGLLGELAYWTIFGVDRDEGAKPLLSEDGAIETPAGFTLEPFVRIDGRLTTWADVTTTQSLEQRSLPLPSTTWHHPKFTLEIAPFGAGSAAAPIGYARYRLRNTSGHAERAQFFIAVRPLRVTPPWHELNIAELTAPIRTIEWNGRELKVDDTRIVPLTKPARVTATAFDGGDAIETMEASIVEGTPATYTGTSTTLRKATITLQTDAGDSRPLARAASFAVTDPQRHASTVMMWDLTLAAGEERIVDLATPLHANDQQMIPGDVAHQRAKAVAYWRAIADHVQIDIPAARDLVDTARANVAYNLLGRDGPAIRGGARNYRRSWIRDGSLASTMLLRFGLNDDVRDYIRWFAPYQFADGKIPCCVDTRGADPVAEHDSHGEFIYLVAEYTRLGGDLSLARETWPHVLAAAKYLEGLREVRSTQTGSNEPRRESIVDSRFEGILPPSISHEGYSAKPMHSYWDDFFALRGLKDATCLAEQLGERDAASHIAAVRDAFARDFHASIRNAIAFHHIDFIPGSADLGDFDPTSTTIGIEPGGDLANLPHDAVIHEFTRAWNESLARMNGGRTWKDYTPYELRQVGTFVHLGWRDRAQQLLQFFLDDRRPRGWNQWAEVVAQDYRAPAYLGDIPHLWVGSDFVRSFIDMLAYEREEDDALVVGAGIRDSWLDQGVQVRGLRTIYGALDFFAKREGKQIVVNISGVRVPKGGIVLTLPGVGERVIRSVPARVTLVP